jgi:hypothetical protein
MGLFDRASDALSVSDVQRLERDVKGAIIELRDAIDNKSGDTTHNIQEFLAD